MNKKTAKAKHLAIFSCSLCKIKVTTPVFKLYFTNRKLIAYDSNYFLSH